MRAEKTILGGASESCSKQKAVVVFLVALCTSLVGSGLSTGDDTYIYMTYARSLFDGQGYKYNGIPSSGATSLGWLIVAGGVSKITGLEVTAWKLLGAMLFSASIVLILKTRNLNWILLLAILLNPLTLRWSSSGMENSLTMLFIAAIFYYTISEEADRYRVFLIAPFAALCRPELILLVFFTCTLCAVLNNLDLKKIFAYLFPGFASLAALALYFDFSLIPQTAKAKSLFLSQPEKQYSIETLFKIFFVSGGMIIISAIVRFKSFDKLRWFFLSCLIYSLIICGYLIYQNSLISTRYETSIFLPVLLLSIFCLSVHYRQLSILIKSALFGQIFIALGLFLFFFPVKLSDEGKDISKFAIKAREVIIGQKGALETVALSEVGAFAYYSGLPIADTLGLVSNHAIVFYEQTKKKPAQNIETLEHFLSMYNINYYVETFGRETPMIGKDLNFIPLHEATVTRNNMSKFDQNNDRWRLYKIEYHR